MFTLPDQALPVLHSKFAHFVIRKCRAAAKVAQQRLRRSCMIRRLFRFLSARYGPFTNPNIEALFVLPSNDLLWRMPKPDQVNDPISAMHYCVTLLCHNPQVWARFPGALSKGVGGEFAQWVITSGGLSPGFRKAVIGAFEYMPSETIRRIFSLRHDLRDHFPLGLTPDELPALLRWLIEHGRREHRLTLPEIWWFALECWEDPARGLVHTFLLTPDWQRAVPDGLTIFGRHELARWLSQRHGVRTLWADPSAWPLTLPSAQQIRLAYHSHENWRNCHPAAFSTLEHARALVSWLVTAESGLPDDARSWCANLDFDAVVHDLCWSGVNLLGHFSYVSGLRRSAEMVAASIANMGRQLSLRDVWVHPEDRAGPERAHQGLEVFDTTIIHVEPEPLFKMAYARSGLAERGRRTYRIGYWYWELETVPQAWEQAAGLVDELWTATDFVADALRPLGVPVYTMPPGISLPVFSVRPRSAFGLPDDKLIFMFVFHMASGLERKNPLGLIEAFGRAFGPDTSVLLVIKTSGGDRHPAQLAALRDAAVGRNIMLIDRAMTDDQTLALIQLCDCYASLHRSEGYGLAMAEAMLLGKPVIATGYSGNLAFMHADNSCLVNYRLVRLERDVGEYHAGIRWAEPSIDHAADMMRSVRDNPAWRAELGSRAQADVRERLSIELAGRRMVERLAQIERASLELSCQDDPPR